jgi:hypothetical protein
VKTKYTVICNVVVTLALLLGAAASQAQTTCTDDAECDDGLFCNGVEECGVRGECNAAPGDPCGARETCNEVTDTCEGSTECTDDAECDDGVFCNGVEKCGVGGECNAAVGDPCGAGETCSEVTDTCDDAGVANDICEDLAEPIDLGQGSAVRMVDTTTATVSLSDPQTSCGMGVDGATVWYRVFQPVAGPIQVSVTSSSYDTVLSVWGEDCSDLMDEVACDDDGGGGGDARVDFEAEADQEYLVQLGAYNMGSGGTATIQFIPQPTGDLMAAASLLTLAALATRARSRKTEACAPADAEGDVPDLPR